MHLERAGTCRWMIPMDYQKGMRVPGIVYADEELIGQIQKDESLQQVANVACLEGIVKYSLAMPDIHLGYGFPIGGVAAFDVDKGGVISPGGVGYDINCGVRLIRSNLRLSDIEGKTKDIVRKLFARIPCGVGCSGELRLSRKELEKVLMKGSQWAVERGYGTAGDVEHTEEQGAMSGADPRAVSSRAFERGLPQLGTLGAGNHFLEIQVVDEIYEENCASAFGIFKGQITIMIHCGSRGFGHQVCDDYISVMRGAMNKYNITVPDAQLACAPVNSDEGKSYFSAMACAANFAWANRQCIMHGVREVFQRVFGAREINDLELFLVYDVTHNVAKIETHNVDGEARKLCVHRKGATRAFPAGHSAIPEDYRSVGQPVIIPGDMGTNSFLLVGADGAMEQSWGSACHGAGRVLSRHAAIKALKGRDIVKELEREGIVVCARGAKTLAEEAPEAYKDITRVVETIHRAGISRKVARMRPIGVVKG